MMFECIPAPNKRAPRAGRNLDVGHRHGAAPLAARMLLIGEHVERQADGGDHGIDGTGALSEPGLESPVPLDLQGQPLAVRAVRRGRELMRRDTRRVLAERRYSRLK